MEFNPCCGLLHLKKLCTIYDIHIHTYIAKSQEDTKATKQQEYKRNSLNLREAETHVCFSTCQICFWELLGLGVWILTFLELANMFDATEETKGRKSRADKCAHPGHHGIFSNGCYF